MAPHDLRERKAERKRGFQEEGLGVGGGGVGEVEVGILIWFVPREQAKLTREVILRLVVIPLKVSAQKPWGHERVLGRI